MSSETISTRRRFLKHSALLAAPVAAVGMPAVAMASDGKAERLARLENEAAIRALHRDWLRQVNGGDAAAKLGHCVSGVFEDHAGEPLEVRFYASGTKAQGTIDCTVEIETELPLDCTLAQMAHAQGEGRIRRRERRVLTADYVKVDDVWAISRVSLASV